MTAVLWLLLSVYAGWQITNYLAGDAVRLIRRMGSAKTAVFCLAPWTVCLLRTAMAVSIGLLVSAWLTYGIAAALNPLLPAAIHPLLPANLLLLNSLAVWAGIRLYRRRADLFSRWPALARALRDRPGVFACLTVLIWILFAWWLMNGTFFRLGSQIHAGYSVFSDFAPHTALVSSFSQGRNWPTEYPHFPNDGIAYHFMFFFLCGNLNFLGLPLDWAINVPSILALVCFCLLLGFLAVRLTGRTPTFLLAPLMLFWRSSTAFFTNLSAILQNTGIRPGAWGEIWHELVNRAAFIGVTPRDDWGLWGINVYANQRHLLFGLSLLLVVLLLLLPDLQAGSGLSLRKKWFSPAGWLTKDRSDWRRIGLAAAICVLLPYWHGSALIALLLVLLPLALAAVNRLGFLLIAIVSFLSALGQSWIFSGQATRVIQPSLCVGFIAPDHSLAGMLAYLLLVTGAALPLLAVAFWLPGRRRKLMIFSFMLPLVFAFTISLTPDVTVNHKFIITGIALANIYLADLLVRLWTGFKPVTQARPPEDAGQVPAAQRQGLSRRCTRALAIVLGFLLMVTGLYECRLVRNINQNSVSIDLQSPLVLWVKENTRPDAVFVSAPYHYHAFFLSGRSIWFGHSYYAWSAGHDTAARFEQLRSLLSGTDGDLNAIQAMIQTEQLDYLIIDDTLRAIDDLPVDEAFFNTYFHLAADFPALGNLKIYDLSSKP